MEDRLQKEFLIIKDYQSGIGSHELAKKYNYKTHKSILDILKKHNIPRRNTQEMQRQNTSYANLSFRTIDTKEMAYCIGLLLTDGYISEKKDSVCIGIDLTDLNAIKLVSTVLQSKIITIKPKNPNHLIKYRVTIFGKQFLKDLSRLGIIPRKTFTTPGPNLNSEEKVFLKYIIRGIIDGDGWIRKDGKEFFISTASENFAKWCLDSLEELGFKNLKIKFYKNDYNGYYLIRNASKENIKILKSIYSDKLGMEAKRSLLLG